MKARTTFAALATLLFVSGAALAAPDAGMADLSDLGRLNGQALACGQMQAVGEAKALMIKHAPKTRRYGEVFEEATNSGFLAQGKAATCPSPAELAERMGRLATRLQATLPPAQ